MGDSLGSWWQTAQNAYDSVSSTVSSGAQWAADKATSAYRTASQSATNLYNEGAAALSSVKQRTVQAARNGADWVAQQTQTARKLAHNLYNRSTTELSSVGDRVARKAQQVKNVAVSTADQVRRTVAPATNAVTNALRDDTNVMGRAKWINPTYYTGVGVEYLGKGLKAVEKGADFVTEGMSEQQRQQQKWGVANPITDSVQGSTSGLISFAGSFVGGIGSLVDYGGRMMQGDKQTVGDTVDFGRKVGETVLYVNGQTSRIGGRLTEQLGEKTGSDTLVRFGRAQQVVGTQMKSMASDDTKRAIDMVEGGAINVSGRVNRFQGNVLSQLGRATGSDTLQQLGRKQADFAVQMQEQTENNPLVKAGGDWFEQRKTEYKERGIFALSRDTTRVVAEVATVVVSPETLVGKAGEGAKVAEAANDVVKLAETTNDVTRTVEVANDVTKGVKAGETVVDVARTNEVATTAEKTTEIARTTEKSTEVARTTEKAAVEAGPQVVREGQVAAKDGGPAWRETEYSSGVTLRERKVKAADGGPDWVETEAVYKGKTNSGPRTRQVEATDGGPAWNETMVDDRVQRTRLVEDPDGTKYMESVDGDNHWGNRIGLREEIVSKGPARTAQVAGPKGPLTVKVYGNPTPEEMAVIEKILADAPVESRPFGTEIYLGEKLGYSVQNGTRSYNIGGLGGDGTVTIERSLLSDPQKAKETIYHEMGHNFDNARALPLSQRGPWGQGRSVSSYGQVNAGEDFAEVHGKVLNDFDRLTKQGPFRWMFESAAGKKAEMLRYYGYDVNRFGPNTRLFADLIEGMRAYPKN